MKIERFEDIEGWQMARELTRKVYVLAKQAEFSRDFGLKEQMQRASGSAMHNIAEGFDRNSDADFTRFLYFSIASCSEVRSMIYLAARLNHVSNEQKEDLLKQTLEISKILRGLIKSISKN